MTEELEKEIKELIKNFDINCDIEEIKAFSPVLLEKMTNYIKLATPYTKPYKN